MTKPLSGSAPTLVAHVFGRMGYAVLCPAPKVPCDGRRHPPPSVCDQIHARVGSGHFGGMPKATCLIGGVFRSDCRHRGAMAVTVSRTRFWSPSRGTNPGQPVPRTACQIDHNALARRDGRPVSDSRMAGLCAWLRLPGWLAATSKDVGGRCFALDV